MDTEKHSKRKRAESSKRQKNSAEIDDIEKVSDNGHQSIQSKSKSSKHSKSKKHRPHKAEDGKQETDNETGQANLPASEGASGSRPVEDQDSPSIEKAKNPVESAGLAEGNSKEPSGNDNEGTKPSALAPPEDTGKVCADSTEPSHEPTRHLSVTLHGSDSLSVDCAVFWPVVRVHVLDGDTGLPFDIPMLHHHQQDPTETHHPEPAATSSSSTSAYQTNPCDVRKFKGNCPHWEETVSIPIPQSYVGQNDPQQDQHQPSKRLLILFEVLDSSAGFLFGRRQVAQNGLYPLAWAFMKLTDRSGQSLFDRKLKLQLYRYPAQRSLTSNLWSGLLSCFCCYPRLSSDDSQRFQKFRQAFWQPATASIHPPDSRTQITSQFDRASIPAVFYTFMDRRNRLDDNAFPASLHITLASRPSSVAFSNHGEAVLCTPERASRSPIPIALSPIRSPAQLRPTSPTMQTSVVGLDPEKASSCVRAKHEPCRLPSRMRSQFCAGEKGCLALAFSPCGRYSHPYLPLHTKFYVHPTRYLAAGICDATQGWLRVYDMQQKGALVTSVAAHSDTIHGLCYGPTSPFAAYDPLQQDIILLSCSADKTARVWRLIPETPKNTEAQKQEDGASAAHLESRLVCFHPCPVYAAVFHADGGVIITGGEDAIARLWSLRSGTILASLSNHGSSRITTLATDMSGTRLYSGDANGKLVVWSAPMPKLLHYPHHQALSASLLANDRSHMSESSKPLVETFAPHFTVRKVLSIVEGSGVAHLILCASDKSLIIQSRLNDILCAVDTTSFQVSHQYYGGSFSPYPARCVVSPDGAILLCSTKTGRLCFWNRKTGQHLVDSKQRTSFGFQGPIYATAWSPTEHAVAFAGYGSLVNLISIWCTDRVGPLPITEEASPEAKAAARVPGNIYAQALLAASSSPSREKLDVRLPTKPVGNKAERLQQIVDMWRTAVEQRERQRRTFIEAPNSLIKAAGALLEEIKRPYQALQFSPLPFSELPTDGPAGASTGLVDGDGLLAKTLGGAAATTLGVPDPLTLPGTLDDIGPPGVSPIKPIHGAAAAAATASATNPTSPESVNPLSSARRHKKDKNHRHKKDKEKVSMAAALAVS